MRVTIVKDDNTVIVDGVRHAVDCSALPANFHALQWDGVRGEVEFASVTCPACAQTHKAPNTAIAGLEDYQALLNAWTVANDAAKAAAEQAAGDAA